MTKNSLKVVGIIPARGGSKGLPRKNMKSLLGKPLIAWTIEQARNSKYIDRVVVSTEDKEIAEISKRYGVEVIERPKELARDNSPTVDAIMHVINCFEEKGEFFDIVVLLEPTSPLRKENDIDDAIELFIKNINNADSLVSVGEVHMEKPDIMKKIENGYVKSFIGGKKIYQRQQASKVYFPYGVIYLSKIDMLRKYKTFYQERTISYLIERWQNYEIDDMYDFMCVEKITEQIVKKDLGQVFDGNKKNVLTIEGNKIYLREFTDENLYDPRYYQWLRDLDIVKTVGRFEYLKPIRFSEIENHIKKLLSSDNDCFFAIYLKENNEFIGTLKIGLIDWQSKTADMGVLIGNKDYQGQGLSKDALITACNYAFKFLGMRKLTGGCIISNLPMVKCFESIGFKNEAVRRKQSLFEGEYVDHILYGMLKNEFFSKNKQLKQFT